MFKKIINILMGEENSLQELSKASIYCVPVVDKDILKEGVSDSLTKDLEISKNKSLQDTKNGYVSCIPVEKIRPNPDQPRSEFNDSSITELAKTIKLKGLIQPIVVRTVNPQEANFELIAGERRLRAVMKLSMKTIPAVVRDDIPVSDIRTLSLIENIQREELSVLDKAVGFYELKEELGDSKTVAETLGLSKKTVERYLKIAKAVRTIPEIEELIKNMDFRDSFRVCLLEENLLKVKEEDHERFSRLIQRLREGEEPKSLKIYKSIKIRPGKRIKKTDANKLLRKSFRSTDTKLCLNLKINKTDISRPEVRDFVIGEIHKFLDALGIKVKSFEIEA